MVVSFHHFCVKMSEKQRAPRNKTLTVNRKEANVLSKRLLNVKKQEALTIDEVLNKTILGDTTKVLKALPNDVFDLIVIDPPYNLDKNFNGMKFKSTDLAGYVDYLNSWFGEVVRTLKPTGSLYLCGDWKNTSALHQVMEQHLVVKNRITWQREKGRGAKSNWKNSMEDIWYGVKDAKNYYFDVEAVKMKRKVLAPYKENGKPKDWEATKEGKFRLTFPSNFWDDLSVPYWSMAENTDHPTQKPEKLVAKLILASCPQNGIVFDPFLGSGTTSVVAKKLGRNYVGIELNKEYAIWTEKRLELVDQDSAIQGYVNGVFWERNTLAAQLKAMKNDTKKGAINH